MKIQTDTQLRPATTYRVMGASLALEAEGYGTLLISLQGNDISLEAFQPGDDPRFPTGGSAFVRGVAHPLGYPFPTNLPDDLYPYEGVVEGIHYELPLGTITLLHENARLMITTDHGEAHCRIAVRVKTRDPRRGDDAAIGFCLREATDEDAL